jgi:hypothetical protein
MDISFWCPWFYETISLQCEFIVLRTNGIGLHRSYKLSLNLPLVFPVGGRELNFAIFKLFLHKSLVYDGILHVTQQDMKILEIIITTLHNRK